MIIKRIFYGSSVLPEFEKYLDDNGVGFKSISAFEYYYEAKIFTNKVITTIGGLNNYGGEDPRGGIKQQNIVQINGNEGAYTDPARKHLYLSVDTGNTNIFDTTKLNNDPLDSSSIFNNHRMAVIRKSIETNLTAAIANYNTRGSSGSTYEFVMPIINEIRWDYITNNVSIVSFMQGLPLGYKYYNNYSVITNTRCGEVVNEQSLYILVHEKNTNNYEYHQAGCEDLIKELKDSGKYENPVAYSDLSYMRQTAKISDARIRYFYPQARGNNEERCVTTGCYNCIVNATPDFSINEIITGKIRNKKTGALLYDADLPGSGLRKVLQAYLTGLARERYDLYKSNNSLK